MSPSTDFDVLAYRANFIRSVPLALAVPFAIGFFVVQAGVPFDAPAVISGSIGWLIALAFRAPLAGVVMAVVQQDRFTGDPVVAGASGVVEEVVRFALLVVVGHAFSTAVWVGLGWGAFETVWALVSRGAVLALAGRDPESQAVSLLPDTEVNGPYWRVVERLSSTLAHIALTLLISAAPILVLATAVAHATRDALAVRLEWTLRPAQRQVIGLAWAAFLLGAAWLAWANVA